MSLDVREVAKILYKKDVEINEGENPMEVLTKLQEEFVLKQTEISESKYKHGFKNGAKESEKSFKTAFGIDDDLFGQELVDKAKERYETALTSKGANADELQKLKDDYNAKIKSFEENKNASENEWKLKYENLNSEIERAKRENKINSYIASDLTNSDYNWQSDSELKNYQISVVKEQISKLNIKEDATGIFIMNADGSLKTDSLGNVVRFEDEKNKILRAIVGNKSSNATPSFSTTGSQLSIESLKEKLDTLPKGSEEYKKVSKIYTEKLYNT